MSSWKTAVSEPYSLVKKFTFYLFVIIGLYMFTDDLSIGQGINRLLKIQHQQTTQMNIIIKMKNVLDVFVA